jgi:energy-coupling factor transporter transmembrane protein EcfT
MKNNVVVKAIFSAILTALGFLAIDYVFGGFEGRNIFLQSIIYLFVTHLMMFGIMGASVGMLS